MKLILKHFIIIAWVSCFRFSFLFPADAQTINLNFVSAATAEDFGPQDGFFDAFVALNYGSIDDNGFESFRTAAEFDISAIPAGMTVKLATLSVSANVYEGTRSLELNGYAGDGLVQLPDFSRAGFLGNEILTTGTSQHIVFDATGFINSLVGSGDAFAGFNFRENPPNFPNFTVFNIDMTGLSAPLFSIEYEPVPEPTLPGLLGMVLAGLKVGNCIKKTIASFAKKPAGNFARL